MSFKVSEDLNVENILSKITEYDIFNTYCTPFKTLDKFFKSELRVDNSPTCKIFVNERGDLIYHDFNGGSYNCFTYIEAKYNVDFNTALNIVNRDFGLDLRVTWKSTTEIENIKPQIYSGKKRTRNKVTILKKKRRKWNLTDKEYWLDRYGIHSSTLNYFGVEPLQYYWINYSRFTPKSITYSYEFSKGVRDIYSPLDIEYKWPASNTRADVHIYGLKQLPKTGDLLFIVSSLKEVMFLYELGITAVAPQSETVFIPERILNNLKNRFNRIIVMFDFDKAGCVHAQKHANKYNLEYMKFCPVMIDEYKAKDLTDAYEINNNKILNLLHNYETYV